MTKKDYKLEKSKTVRLSDSVTKSITYIANEKKLSESELLRSIKIGRASCRERV